MVFLTTLISALLCSDIMKTVILYQEKFANPKNYYSTTVTDSVQFLSQAVSFQQNECYVILKMKSYEL